MGLLQAIRWPAPFHFSRRGFYAAERRGDIVLWGNTATGNPGDSITLRSFCPSEPVEGPLFDMDQHPVAVDVADLEVADLGRAQPGAILLPVGNTIRELDRIRIFGPPGANGRAI
jgi:hypothetical protein